MQTKTVSTDHFVSSCPILILIEYKVSHDKIEHYIYCQICRYYGILDWEKWYKHQSKSITETKRATILWHMAIQTDRKIKSNRLDIVVKDYKRKKNIPSYWYSRYWIDKDISQRIELNGYKNLEIEIEKMWYLKTITMPVIMGVLGIIKKGIDKNIDQILGSTRQYEIQKIALCRIAHLTIVV